jgi:hypothetical protein
LVSCAQVPEIGQWSVPAPLSHQSKSQDNSADWAYPKSKRASTSTHCGAATRCCALVAPKPLRITSRTSSRRPIQSPFPRRSSPTCRRRINLP